MAELGLQTDQPEVFGSLNGKSEGVMSDEKEAYLGIVGRSYLLCGVQDLGGWVVAFERELHVGLSGSYPEITDQNVIQLQGIAGADCQCEGTTSAPRGKVHAATARLVCACRRAGVLERDGDRFTWSGLAPDMDWHVTLQDHMAGEQLRKFDFTTRLYSY